MTIKRWNAKRDLAEGPIIDALELAGFDVYPLDYPCDLACRKESWPPGMFQFLEVKTGRGKSLAIAKDKRQEAQINFLQTSKTPIVRTPFEALKAIGAMT